MKKSQGTVWLLHTLIVCSLAFVLGCGGSGKQGPTGTIQGKLTVGGKPVPQGTQVQFLGEKDAVSGVTSGDGEFTIMGALVGDYRVCFTAAAASQYSDDPEKAMMKAMENNFQAPEEAATAIPVKYTSPETSGISFTVKEGTNDFTYDIKQES